MNCLESQRISIEQVDAVYRLVQQTIITVYPNYYFPEAVEFFCQIHNRGAIAKDILEGAVYGLFQGKELLATGSYHNGHIARLFVASNLRGQGLGGRLLEDLEYRIALERTKAVLDASRPAEEFYRHRGYWLLHCSPKAVDAGIRRSAFLGCDGKIALPIKIKQKTGREKDLFLGSVFFCRWRTLASASEVHNTRQKTKTTRTIVLVVWCG